MEKSRRRRRASTTSPSNDDIIPAAVSSHVRLAVRARALPAPVPEHSASSPAFPDPSREHFFLLPVGLAFIGGTLGGVMGGGAIALELEIASATASHWVKVVAILAVTWSALSLLAMAVWLVGRMLTRQAHTLEES